MTARATCLQLQKGIGMIKVQVMVQTCVHAGVLFGQESRGLSCSSETEASPKIASQKMTQFKNMKGTPPERRIVNRKSYRECSLPS